MNEIDEVRNRIKNKSRYSKKSSLKIKSISNGKYFKPMIFKFLITSVLVLAVLVVTKTNDKYKAIIKQNVYEENFSFAVVNDLYTKYLGPVLPFKDLKIFKEEVKTTFDEKLSYSEANKYLDGVKLTVDDNYLVPIQESGMVVFQGEKEGYGNIVIIQQTNGIDLWYGNLDNINVQLYDYVEKGKLLGEVKKNELYLVYQKDVKYLDYKEYIEKA